MDILNDPDLASVKEQDWFVEFMETLNKKTEETAENKEAVVDPTSSKWKLVEKGFGSEETPAEQ